MRKLFIILIACFFILPGLLIAQEEPQVAPVGAWFKLGVMQGYHRTSMAFDYSFGLKYNVSENTKAYLALAAYRAEWDKEQGLSEIVELEENVGIKVLIRQWIWKGWWIEGGPGLDRLDLIGDDQTANTYTTGAFNIVKTWDWRNISYGLSIGTDYNFGKAQSTPKVGLVIEFNQGE